MSIPTQFLFVVETSNAKKSDEIYISEVLNTYYNGITNKEGYRFSYIYLGGKYNATKKNAEIKSQTSKWKKMNEGITHVIYFLDKDDFDSNPNDAAFQKNIEEFCRDKKYDIVWFVRNIEHVFLGRKINKDKTKEATKFKIMKGIISIEEKYLHFKNPCTDRTSNILCVLDQFLERNMRSEKDIQSVC